MGSEEETRLLKKTALTWVRVVQRLAPRLGVSRLPAQLADLASGRQSADEWMIVGHVLAIAFRQIEQHLKKLEPSENRNLSQAAANFFAEYEKEAVKDLRDVLEHHAEYVVGTGRKPALVVDRSQPLAFGSAAGGRAAEQIWVYLFGKTYQIDPLVRAALDLEEHLRSSVEAESHLTL